MENARRVIAYGQIYLFMIQTHRRQHQRLSLYTSIMAKLRKNTCRRKHLHRSIQSTLAHHILIVLMNGKGHC